jgi:hypothetical protein
MDSSTSVPIIGIISRMAEAYDKRLSAEVLSAYAEDLAPYPIWDIQAVAGSLRKTSEHWPRIPAWIEALKALQAARDIEYRPPQAGQFCSDCGDNGYVSYICTATDPCQRCRDRGRILTGVVQRDPTTDLPLKDEHGKPVMHYLDMDHSFARPCGCRASNPNINGSRRRENETTSQAPRPRRKQSW